jgi:proprotein convertase subtilisin/kexin type 5
MENAKIYFQNLLKVIPAQSPNKFKLQKCYDVEIPSKYTTDGENNSDIHIWVIYKQDRNSDVLANAVYCGMDDTLKRVNFGRILINVGKTSRDEPNSSFESDLLTVIHECLHIFGFSGNLYKNWVDPDTGNYYGTNVNKIIKTATIRGKKTSILASKNVLKTAQKYYGCPTLEGM